MPFNRYEPDLDIHWRDLDCADPCDLRRHLRHHHHWYPVRKAAYEACVFVAYAFWKESSVT